MTRLKLHMDAKSLSGLLAAIEPEVVAAALDLDASLVKKIEAIRARTATESAQAAALDVMEDERKLALEKQRDALVADRESKVRRHRELDGESTARTSRIREARKSLRRDREADRVLKHLPDEIKELDGKIASLGHQIQEIGL